MERKMVTRNRNWFSRGSGNSPARIETENHFTGPRVAQFFADNLLHIDWIRVQSFKISLLFLQTRARSRKFCGTGGLILLQFAILAPGFKEERTRPDPKSGQEDDVKQGDKAARVQSSYQG